GRSDAAGRAGTNPYPGVTIYYQLPDDIADDTEIALEVMDGDDTIWTWTREPLPGDKVEEGGPNAPPRTDVLPAEAGLNKFSWNLNTPSFERFDNLILWINARSGPSVPPGSYRARLTVGDEVQETRFEVVADPRSSLTQADYEARYSFATETRDIVSRTHTGIRRIRSLKGQLEAAQGRVEEESDVAASIQATLDSLTAIEETLYQTKNESRQDPLNFPIRLNNKLSYVLLLGSQSAAAPTASMIAVRDELAEGINAELAKLDAVFANDVPALNRALADLDLIAVEDPE
ncbi:MAG: glycosyl hydrolase, partial [Pseudomonadota bacterium]